MQSKPIPRIQVLHNQEAWVADDEMDFYLHMINTTGAVNVGRVGIVPAFFEDDELEGILHQWFSAIIPATDYQGKTISALYVDKHWFPVVITPQAGSILVQTTPGGIPWMEIAVRTQGIEYSLAPVPGAILGAFNNDCGFQVIAWLTEAVFNSEFGTPFQRVAPIELHTAIAWRGIFEQHLHLSKEGQALIAPTTLFFGGAATMDTTKLLAELLADRGVPLDAVQQRAESVIEKLGRQPILKALRSQNPWREAKHLANLAAPKIQLVMQSEMQAAIQARIDDGQPFGDKKKKLAKERKPRKELALEASDVGIPEGIFRDANNAQLTQIPIQNIGPEARGVVVVTAEQAAPYLRFSQPVSKHGLALIVINHSSPLVHGSGEEIRFPARFERTAEPILLSARIIQIGNIEVTRVSPQNITKVDEVSTVVIRICTYRDELQAIKWDVFCTKPIKHIVEDVPFLQPSSDGTSPIIDVWDRQWLTERLERTKPSDATLFCACFRVELTELLQVLQHQGRVAHYLESRSQDGRTPNGDFRVIWINKKDRQAVVLASQSTAQWTCIVRAGHRFGLRTQLTDAKVVHEQHKPQTPYLETADLLTFHAGPFPHGSNRSALVKLFATWGWQARPTQPKARTANGQGVIWEVQAVAKPQFEVYQLAHADILITEIPRKTNKSPANANDIQGSARTIAALTKDNIPHAPADPWDSQDPWSGYQPPAKISKITGSHELREGEIDAIAARVQQKLHNIKPQPNRQTPHDEDANMQTDDRVGQLEERLNQMETTMHEQHRQQTQITSDLASQITAVQHQTQAIHSHIDQRMQEQLTNIERLLSKRRAE